MVADEHMEGWYTDPFGRHDARWMSAGIPTRLVRDGDRESYDDPPDGEPMATPTRIDEGQASDGSDLLRADDPDADVTLHQRMEEAGEDSWGAQIWLHDRTDER
ncbi:MAG: hypothetical protein WAL61_14860 [Acidimicrobiales bacterium]